MASEQPGFSSSFTAGADLTNSQYYFVKLDSSGNIIPCAATTDKPIGVLQNNPPNAGEALVMHAGISKISADAALAIDDLVGTSVDGQGAKYVPGTDTTKYIVGRMLDAAGATAAGELGTMLFNCMSMTRGA